MGSSITACVRGIVRGGLLAFVACMAGCSSSGGTFTLFPTGDYLTKDTKFVRNPVPSSVPAPRELQKVVLPSYMIQPGDQLLVEPVNIDSQLRFPADQTVMPDGTIDLGRFGRLIVAGKTIEVIEADVAAAIRAVEPRSEAINVRLVNPQSAVYYVLGEVNSPGSYPLIGRETVLDGILAAGGLNDRASPCNIILSRPTLPSGCRIVIPICYRQITQLGDTTTNFQLMPGDRIVVATRTFCESLLPCRRSCQFCKGLQCPCPPSSAVFPATTIYDVPNWEEPLPPGAVEATDEPVMPRISRRTADGAAVKR
ncbi:MAG TPA: SLBB domain-containing protein [Pirellulales bacterium]|nr:SLBB domain-containing protein [Pirellulales bacterium]